MLRSLVGSEMCIRDRIDTKTLLHEIKSWLQSSGSYLAKAVDYTALKFTQSGVQLDAIGSNGVRAKKIIFCEGYQAINNPWLKKLPFKLSKGEILTLKNNSSLQQMLSWGRWYVPHGSDQAKLGSNYAWDDLSLEPSADIKNKLLSSLREHLNIDTQLINHEVGVRPTTKHRQPFIGPISGLSDAYCFNGFGSKGCLTIPRHAIDLCNLLLNDKALSPEVCKWL